MRLLRVLRLPFIKRDIRTTESLVQLRYLETPYKVGRLENLEFLIITSGNVGIVFSDIPKLRLLKFKYPKTFHSSCDFTSENSIETLSGVCIYSLKDEEKLRYFPHLRRLKCFYILRNHCPDLSFFTKLESLSMLTFQKLKLINFPPNIKKLSLFSFDISCEIMSSIEKLPNLETLKLESLDFKGENWSTNEDEFLKLKFLKLISLKFENWNTSKDHFPTLERLVMENCDYFKRIPSELGYIPTLQMIEVNSCGISIRESADEIRKEQEEEGNEELQVIINGRN